MGVVTSIFSRDATPLAEDPLGGEGRADDLSFLLLRLKDMGEDVAPASGVDSRPHRERAFVQACHQALGAQAWDLTGGTAPGIGRTARAILGMAFFVSGALSKIDGPCARVTPATIRSGSSFLARNVAAEG